MFPDESFKNRKCCFVLKEPIYEQVFCIYSFWDDRENQVHVFISASGIIQFLVLVIVLYNMKALLLKNNNNGDNNNNNK